MYLRGSQRAKVPHWGDFIDSVSKLGFMRLAPRERGEVGQQLEDFAARRWGCPRGLQLGVPS